ncbi:hypothetical protein [Streptomyces sp. NPDC004629]|uniref:hypothetical protein n=1 Tax=Streptomyces sp. NPDC004629 TaxID=3364705 RepID=UPI0036AAC00B
MMPHNVKIGAALVGGYVLGRTKKAKTAIGLGMLLAGKKLNLDPRQLGSALSDSPLLDGLNDQVRREFLDAARSAATSALTQRIGGFADSLHERTLRLEGRGHHDEAAAPDSRREDADARGASTKGTAKGAAKGSAKAKASPRRSPSSAGAHASGAAKKTASGGTRKASSGARKSASSARKAASGTARRTGRGGGDHG